MTEKELYRMIDLQPEMTEKLEEIGGRTDLGKIDVYLEQMMDIKTAGRSYQQLKTFLREDADQLNMLYCQLECARRSYGRYQEKQIPRTVYIDTMRCFTRFIEECKEKNGRMFFDRGWWTYRQISMNIFRIGTLEYQFKEEGGRNVISIHIPSDADLSEESVDVSLEMADHFFQTYYQDYEYSEYTCNSWLLSPALGPLLSHGSNILAFQDRFAIKRENRDDMEYIEWLFRVPAASEHLDLPEKTSLQRKVKELLLNKGTVGSAFGVMERSK